IKIQWVKKQMPQYYESYATRYQIKHTFTSISYGTGRWSLFSVFWSGDRHQYIFKRGFPCWNCTRYIIINVFQNTHVREAETFSNYCIGFCNGVRNGSFLYNDSSITSRYCRISSIDVDFIDCGYPFFTHDN